MACQPREFLAALGRQFARRRNYQRARTLGAVAMQPVDERDQERGGLAAAGLGADHQVAALERHGDGFALDWGGLMIATVADRTLKFREKREIGKGQSLHFDHCLLAAKWSFQ